MTGNAHRREFQRIFYCSNKRYLQSSGYLRKNLIFPGCKRSIENFHSGCLYEIQIKMQIVDAANHRTENFIRNIQMAEICARVFAVGEKFASGVYRRKVVFPFLVAHVQHAFPSENHAIATVACGHHAVEHIHAVKKIIDKRTNLDRPPQR